MAESLPISTTTRKLLLLNYSNASVALPQVIAAPDWDFLAVTLSIVVVLCIVAFFSGWLIAKLLRVDGSQQIALMFGLGMNNNGTGLVLASMALADHPDVLLPIIFYNLVQHLVAGCVDPILSKTNTRHGSPNEPPNEPRT
jgi:bile acid:Na+ symporter, BASS family